ncbi:MAG: hypothetical protein LC624_01360, partial [Halobacteriales archaeon]|nr:hypothetical protein [Halobacteriales archaeon]
APAYDPRAPLERWPLYVGCAALFLLHVEFGALHARVERLGKLPRAHVTQVGQAQEVELAATARRIAEGWPAPLLLAMALVGAMMAVQLALAGIAPRALGQSVELRGAFGLALAGCLVLGALALVAWRRRQGEAGGSPGP